MKVLDILGKILPYRSMGYLNANLFILHGHNKKEQPQNGDGKNFLKTLESQIRKP
jgi:hypothetical protein